jgi:hypothetical protein
VDGDEANRVISDFQQRLQDRLFEVENKVDNAVTLLAGGAFTVSLAIVPTLDSPLGLRWALVTAWASWAACLLVDLLGNMTSAAGHRRMLTQLCAGNYDPQQLEGGWHRKAIPWFNRAVFLLLVSGFVTFGAFVLDNLTFGDADEEVTHQRASEVVREAQGQDQGQSQDQAQTKDQAQSQVQGAEEIGEGREQRPTPLREQPAPSPGGLAAPKAGEDKKTGEVKLGN